MKEISDHLKDFHKSAIAELEEAQQKRKIYRAFINPKSVALDEFAELIKIKCNTLFITRGSTDRFQFDQHSKPVLVQLYKWMVGDSSFNGDLQKGIIMQGLPGVGKTAILKSFMELYSGWLRMNCEFILADDIRLYMKKDRDFWNKRHILIDDIGREDLTINEYGNKTAPFPRIIGYRYESGATTFGTTNYPLLPMKGADKCLKDFYGEFITDRMKAMFNFMIYTGNSRRK